MKRSARGMSIALRGLLVLVVLAKICSAQVTGRLSGRVVDPTGKAIAGAKVTVLIPDSSVEESSTLTSEDGTYFFPVLRPLFYDLQVEAPNFKQGSIKNVKVDPTSETSLPPLKLELGTVQEKVETQASVQNLQTNSAEVSEVANYLQVSQLPFLGRDPLQLLDTLPGVQSNGRGPRTIDGQPVSFSNITFDGINVQTSFIRSTTLDFTTLGLRTDQVSEATIVTVNPGAIYSGGSTQVAFSSPSGSNSLHGSVYLLNQPGAISAQSFSDNAFRTPSVNKLNQVGATLGGPLKKGKLYYFLNYEADLDRSNITRVSTVPTSPVTSQDPLLNTILAGLPSSSSGTYRTLQNNGLDSYLGLGRLDYLYSSRNVFGLTFANRSANFDLPFDGAPYARQANTSELTSSPFYSVSWRFMPTARITNEARYGQNRPSIDFVNSARNLYGFVVFLPSGTYTSPISGLDPQGRDDYLYNFQDNLTIVKNRHSLQMGASTQQYRLTAYGTNYGNGLAAAVPSYFIDSLSAGTVFASEQPYSLQSPTSGYVARAGTSRPSANLASGYFQDNWRVRDRLTLILGLRYDYLSVVNERTNSAVIPIFNGPSSLYDPNLPFSFVSKSHPYYHPDRNNFAPYVGIAWKVREGNLPLVVRGAYSISYVNDDQLRNLDQFVFSGPFQNVVGTRIYSPPAALSSHPAPLGPPTLPALNLKSVDQAFGYNTVFGVDPNLRTPYVQQANLGVETQIKGFQLGVRYAGNRLVDGLRSVDRNPVLLSPDFLAQFAYVRAGLQAGILRGFTGLAGGGILTTNSQGKTVIDTTAYNYILGGESGALAQYYQANGYNAAGNYAFFGNPNAPYGLDVLSNLGRSRYDALQITASRRAARGLNLTAAYVYSKAISNLDDYQQGAIDPYLDLKNPNLDSTISPLNLTHAFKFTVIYDLPFARSAHGLKGAALGGWSLRSILLAQSGAPFSILSGAATFGTPQDSGQNPAFSSLSRGQIGQYFGVQKAGDGTVSFINNAPGTAFSQPVPGAIGNLGKREFEGPGAFTLNLGINKTFTLTERAHLDVRGEAINLPNRVNWVVPDQYLAGTSSATGNALFSNSVFQSNNPRVFQFSARVQF